jgi:TolB protein
VDCIAFASLDLSRDPPKYDLFVIAADGSRLTRITRSATGSDFSPSWSPDGEKIAYRHETSFDGDSFINVMDADGSDVRQLREGISPAWSPDGTRIAFAGASEGPGTDIFVMDRDGSRVRRLTRTPGRSTSTPRGRRMAARSSTHRRRASRMPANHALCG